jgi:hypothetical protein
VGRRRIAALVVLGALAAPTAHATHAVDAPAVEQGEALVTFNGHRSADSDDDFDGAGEYAFELAYSPTSYWRSTLGWVWLEEPGDSPRSEALVWQNSFELTEPGKHWADLGLLVAYGQRLDDGADAAELALLVQKALGRSTLLVNLIAVRELEGDADTGFGYSLSWATPVRDGLELGLEWYGELGESNDLGRLLDRPQQAGPVVYGTVPGTGRGEFVYEAAVLFGLTSAAPDATFRLLLEYAF